MAKEHCEVFVYLCEQNQSLPQFGNVAKNLETDTWTKIIESKRKTGSLERLRAKDRLISMSPLRNLFLPHSLTPWRSLRNLAHMSTSDSSVNNLEACKDFTGSANHIDTDCVSPRVSSNSLASIRIESLDLSDSIFAIPGECNSKSPTLENIGVIYTQKKSVHPNLTKRKTSLTFSRSTSCPHVVPAIHLKRYEDKSLERKDYNKCKSKPRQTKESKTTTQDNLKVSAESTNRDDQQDQQVLKTDPSSAIKQDNPVKDDKGAKKSAQSAKSLARSKCMQWLNSLDEDD